MKSANQAGAVSSALLLAAFAAGLAFARADDFGPRGDVGAVRFATSRLLAHSLRQLNVDPAGILVHDAVVVNDAAVASWTAGKREGVLGFVRYGGRWWNALDYRFRGAGWSDDAWFPLEPHCAQRSSPNPDAERLAADGLPDALASAAAEHIAIFRAPAPKMQRPLMEDRLCERSPVQTAGYLITIAYAQNNSPSGSPVQPLYARAPTLAEIIPYPTTYHFISNAVAYFDLTLDGSTPVSFAPGTTIDIWFPFVLDDTLKYDLTIGFADAPIGPLYAKPFDNTLHYTLPGFTATPGRTLMAEIDGNWPSP